MTLFKSEKQHTEIQDRLLYQSISKIKAKQVETLEFQEAISKSEELLSIIKDDLEDLIIDKQSR
jgi:hypothetical protein